MQNGDMPITINDATGLIRQARQVISTNYDARPAGCEPELIVIHAISLPPGKFGDGYIDQLFCNQLDPTAHKYFAEIEGLRVSAHVLIRRDGELVQYVPLSQRAWHAGESCYKDRSACNDFSLGIELEGDDYCKFTDEQYRKLIELCLVLLDHFPEIGLNDIVGHSDIAPGRKTDPGPFFDWQRLRTALQESDRQVLR